MKKGLLITLIIAVLFVLALFLSYKIVNKGAAETKEENNSSEEISIPTSYTKTETKEENKEETAKYSEINKESQVASDIYDFIPKSFQTYPGKMNEDYMLYEAISRLSKDESISSEQIEGINVYKFEDVNRMLKAIYGDSVVATKKETYASPVEYFENKDAFGMYPVGIDKTDNMMVIKSVEENSSIYKMTVYSVCVYMDLESSDANKLYLVTKDTIRKYYQLVSRNDESIKDTYKEFTLEGTTLNPSDIVEKYEEDLPQIEYYLTKTDDKENKYYVSDIKDIY